MFRVLLNIECIYLHWKEDQIHFDGQIFDANMQGKEQ